LDRDAVTVEPLTPILVTIASALALNQGRAFQPSRDGAGRDRRQCKHVRYRAIAEGDDLRMGLGVSVEQRKLAGPGTIDRYR
jgi:hypothetical protein